MSLSVAPLAFGRPLPVLFSLLQRKEWATPTTPPTTPDIATPLASHSHALLLPPVLFNISLHQSSSVVVVFVCVVIVRTSFAQHGCHQWAAAHKGWVWGREKRGAISPHRSRRVGGDGLRRRRRRRLRRRARGARARADGRCVFEVVVVVDGNEASVIKAGKHHIAAAPLHSVARHAEDLCGTVRRHARRSAGTRARARCAPWHAGRASRRATYALT